MKAMHMRPIPIAIIYSGNTSFPGIRCLKKRYTAMPSAVVKKLAITNLYGLKIQAISIPKPKIITPTGYSFVLGCISHAANKHTKPSVSNTYACKYILFLDKIRGEIFVDMHNWILTNLY